MTKLDWILALSSPQFCIDMIALKLQLIASTLTSSSISTLTNIFCWRTNKWQARTTFEFFITVVNVPRQIEAGQHPRDYLAAALFSHDLNTGKSETIGMTWTVENLFPEDTTIQPSILLPLRFDQRQQLTISIYSSANSHSASNSTSIQERLESLTPNMIGEAIFMASDLFTATGLQQIGPETTGFIQSLKSGLGACLVHDSRPMQVSLHWRERHSNNRSSKLLATCTIDPAFKPSGIDRVVSKPSWRLEARREYVVDVNAPEAKSWSKVLSSGKAVTTSDPSWFLDMIAVDALIPDDGEALRVKLWRSDLLREPRLFGEAFIKRQAVLNWIDLIEQEDKDEARKMQECGHLATIRSSIVDTAPKQLVATMRAVEDESIVMARLSLEAAKIVRTFSLFEYFGSGMRFNLIVAIDVHSSNGEPGEVKSFHFDDPRRIQPSLYFRIMNPVLQFLIPFADKIYPIGFAGRIANQTSENEMGFFNLSRAKPCGLVETFDEFAAAYRDALPVLQMGKKRNLAPALSRAVDDASQATKPDSAPAYSVIVVFTSGVPDDFSQVLKTIQEAVRIPISFMIVGIEPGRSSSRLQKTFERLREPPARLARGHVAERCNVQFVTTAGANEDQCALRFQAMMSELEVQAVTYMKDHRIQPAVVKPLASPEPVPQALRTQLSEFVPAVSGVRNVLRVLSRKPSLSQKTMCEDQAGNDLDVSVKSNESVAVSTARTRGPPQEPIHLGVSQEHSHLVSPGMSRVSNHSREHSQDVSPRPDHINSLPEEQTEVEVQKDKDNAANAIRDKYRLSPQKGMLEYKARTNLRDSIQLKLAMDVYEWKKKMSMVTDTLTEATASASFRAPHQAQRFRVHLKPADGMPRTIFNKAVED